MKTNAPDPHVFDDYQQAGEDAIKLCGLYGGGATDRASVEAGFGSGPQLRGPSGDTLFPPYTTAPNPRGRCLLKGPRPSEISANY